MYNLGIIGGMGSDATLEFFGRILRYDEAKGDQEQLDICILNKSTIPDRSNFIMNRTHSPVAYMNKCIEELSSLQCDFFAIPCNTAHYFIENLVIPKNISLINMVDETLKFIYRDYKDNTVCILGTTGTVNGKVYEKYDYDLNIIYPDENENEILMEAIYSIKAKEDSEETLKSVLGVINSVNKRYNNIIFVVACTELSIYSKYFDGVNIVDSMDILAKESINKCRNLIKRKVQGELHE